MNNKVYFNNILRKKQKKSVYFSFIKCLVFMLWIVLSFTLADFLVHFIRNVIQKCMKKQIVIKSSSE